jgi:hypothetical protein
MDWYLEPDGVVMEMLCAIVQHRTFGEEQRVLMVV